ncbi:AAA family ATPase [Patescibacteria group bacterium]|nr:AAA family ATPase [Patescibacteria group bacterium]MBU4115911.1 AAA family ATPase [Patescibacteria group bacterium]
MNLKSIELSGFKSFATKSKLEFKAPISAIVGPNGSGKSNIAEAFRFVLGEQSIKSMRGKKGEDLIFNGSRNIPRANRASVKITFDNKKRLLDIDYDEVIFERAVYRDGMNRYSINGSHVRLRDIMEILAGANIGSTAHYIISQGEADKILNVNSRERKLMIEDALGLKIYHYKKKESLKKLEKTKQNIKEVEGLRKEIKPHIRFLEKQVKKVERTYNLKDKLNKIYKEYLKRERIYLNNERRKLNEEKIKPQKEYDELNKELRELEKNFTLLNPAKQEFRQGRNYLTGQAKKKEENIDAKELIGIKEFLEKNQKEKNRLERETGRIEGEMSYNEKNLARTKNLEDKNNFVKIPVSNLKDFSNIIDKYTSEAEKANEVLIVKNILEKIKEAINNLILVYRKKETDFIDTEEYTKLEIERLKKEKNDLELGINKIKQEEKDLMKRYISLQKKIESEKDAHKDTEKKIFQIMAQISEIKIQLNLLNSRENKLFSEEANFKNEFSEALVLIKNEMSSFSNYEVFNENNFRVTTEDIINENRIRQEERKREVEKIKIRLEDIGVGSSDEIIGEYKEVKERDDFLEREIGDLKKSKESIGILIKELEEKLDIEFKEGVKKINEQFNDFFVSMFGGGLAVINVVKNIRKKSIKEEIDFEEIIENFNNENEEEIIEEGIDIHISLPHKKIKGLEMLSGGERALTSIALTFAMSQIKPPPFIVLDETDAALDESNSKKYGNIIEGLSKHSQLILVTHNRETMSRVGILYGVTMGSDATSKLLSVEFEEAVKIAK